MTTFSRICATFPVLLLGAAVTLSAGCLDEQEPHAIVHQGLIGGTVDLEDDNVVALTRGGSSSFCTGTLVSPSVVLTAAHCIDMAGNDPNITAFFGADTTREGTKIGVGAKSQNLQWNGDVGANDIGMLLLNFPQDPFLPMRLNDQVAGSALIGMSYRHVGFGVYDRATQAADGQKRTGTTMITNAQGDVIFSGDDNLSVCFGDSGGPGIINVDGTDYVAGVHSFTTSDQCFPPNGDTNVNMYVTSYLLPWIQDNDPACGLDGLCAPIGCTDDPDCEPCGADGNCTADCPLPDPDCPTSGIGEICQADMQCMSGLCVFWSGDPDYNFCAEECELGSDTCPAGMSCQTINPFGNICYYDEPPPGVIGDDCAEAVDCGSYICDQGACTIRCDLGAGLRCPEDFDCASTNDVDYFCVSTKSEDGGCSVSGDGNSDGSWLWLLGLALVLVRRRRH